MQSGPIFLIVLVLLVAKAAQGSSRPWRTVLLILLACALGFGIGAATGFYFGSSKAAATGAVLFMLTAGIAASINQILNNRKERTAPLRPPRKFF